MSDKRELLVTIDGFEIYSNSSYVTEGKIDYTAPSGYIAKGVTALPSSEIDKTYAGPFIASSQGSKDGIWDTGFYPMSPCYAHLGEAEKKAMSAGRKKAVLDKYKMLIGDTDTLEHKDHEGWNKFKVKLKLDRLFNTSNAKDLMDLYMAIHMGVLCPKGKERGHKYVDAAYTVVDKIKQVSIKSSAKLSKFEAIETFSLLWNNDQPRLKDVLGYLNITFGEHITKGDLVTIFDNYMEKGADNIELFTNAVERSETAVGYNEIKLYKNLKELSIKGNGTLTRSPSGKYFYKGFEVGPDLMAAAKNINMSKEFLHIKDELVHLTDED